jgi:hypothetical protein
MNIPLNDYQLARMYRLLQSKQPHTVAYELKVDKQTIDKLYWRYIDQVQSFVKVNKRLPNRSDISNGNFTFQPFDGSHYLIYKRGF